jgi:NADH:ubiquinone oxidoreductase subunit 4 (subunit M)
MMVMIISVLVVDAGGFVLLCVFSYGNSGVVGGVCFLLGVGVIVGCLFARSQVCHKNEVIVRI